MKGRGSEGEREGRGEGGKGRGREGEREGRGEGGKLKGGKGRGREGKGSDHGDWIFIESSNIPQEVCQSRSAPAECVGEDRSREAGQNLDRR